MIAVLVFNTTLECCVCLSICQVVCHKLKWLTLYYAHAAPLSGSGAFSFLLPEILMKFLCGVHYLRISQKQCEVGGHGYWQCGGLELQSRLVSLI